MVGVVSSGGCGCTLRGAVGALNFIIAPPVVVSTRLHSSVAVMSLSLPHPRPQRLPSGDNAPRPSVRFSSYVGTDNTVVRRTSRRSRLSTLIAPHGTAAAQGGSKLSTLISGMNDRSLAEARKQARFDEEGEYRVFRELLEGKKTRFVSRVMYDGTNYKGFQLQTNGLPTVQGVLEKALSTRFQTYVPIVAAGRTDTGVHSIGQAIHFDLPNANEDLAQLTYSMNQMIPEDVRVWNMSVAPPPSPSQVDKGWPWSSMLNARSKRYSYRLFVGQVPNPLDRLYRAHASQAAGSPIDVERLYRTMPKFVGEHDFAGFSNEVDKRANLKREDGLGDFNTRRTVYSAEIIDEGGGNIRLEFHLDGALYRMVRNMVGTLLAVAAGRLEPDIVDEIFRTGMRDSCLIYAAPAHGLTLETVTYDGYS
ncbi:unnamed protein product [Scytosiphon promiscuus]